MVSYLYNLRQSTIYTRHLRHFEKFRPKASSIGERRKPLGYSHIPQRWAGLINAFNREHLNPYLNFHRPCFLPETCPDARGKERKIYRYERLMTP